MVPLVAQTWRLFQQKKCRLTSRGIRIIHYEVTRWKHFPRYWPFVRVFYRLPIDSPHKGQWRGALMISLIWPWTNGWSNYRDAGDLRRHRAHFDATVMYIHLYIEMGPWIHKLGLQFIAQWLTAFHRCRNHYRHFIKEVFQNNYVEMLLTLVSDMYLNMPFSKWHLLFS